MKRLPRLLDNLHMRRCPVFEELFHICQRRPAIHRFAKHIQDASQRGLSYRDHDRLAGICHSEAATDSRGCRKADTTHRDSTQLGMDLYRQHRQSISLNGRGMADSRELPLKKIAARHNAVNSRDLPHRSIVLDYARCMVRRVRLPLDQARSLRHLLDHLGMRSRGHLTSNTGHCERMPIL
jgi:hypothetical protein